MVCQRKARAGEELLNRLIVSVNLIVLKDEIIRNTTKSVLRRAELCKEKYGFHFQQCAVQRN
jgi:hypothetical protein